MDLKEIQSFIRFVARSGASKVKLETKDLKLTVESGDHSPVVMAHQMPIQSMPQSTQVINSNVETPAPPKDSLEEELDSKYIVIKSPMIGTFYRKPSPDKPYFKEVGVNIVIGDTLCIIEAMKLFNEIEAEVSGKIVKVLVEDMSPVEYDQPLFLIDPS